MSLAIAGVELTSRTAAETDMDAAAGLPVSTRQSKSSLSGQHGRERTQASAEACKEGRERREKDKALGRSSRRRRTGESRHKTRGDKIARKSSSRSSFSHRASRDDKKEKSCSSPGSSRHGESHKGVSHTPISKESRTSHKSGRSLSTTSSGSSKRLGRISSFLRNVRANLTTKAVGTPHGRDVDIMAKTVERSTNVANAETAEGGQGLEMVGSMTPDIMETMTFETH